jgi:formylglycine-generating enzyme required for sulfatase activity
VTQSRPTSTPFRTALILLVAAAGLPSAHAAEPPGEVRPGAASGPAAGAASAAAAAPAPPGPGSGAYTNSLNMRFVPVAGTRVWFSVWETRVQDYARFVADSGREWTAPEFPQDPSHPVTNVNWEDAVSFCQWLTEKEREAGRLGHDDRYRLPTDNEWSAAAGLGPESGRTPELRSKNARPWPWGATWPPPPRAGNYGPDLKIDAFDRTAPVGSFAPTAAGLFDLGGNVWEWCEDWYNEAGVTRVLRGGGWADSGPAPLLSSYRFQGTMNLRNDDFGFRIVLDRPE